MSARSAPVAAVSGCAFPVAWHGTWYESDIGDVIISADNVSRKGNCIESSDDFYLLENQYVEH